MAAMVLGIADGELLSALISEQIILFVLGRGLIVDVRLDDLDVLSVLLWIGFEIGRAHV